jgi:hypothetical protein
MDGVVSTDPAWSPITPMTGFTQVRPSEGAPASESTEVYVGYTSRALYIAVVCHDSDPSGIIVSDSRRDADLDETDSFQVILDTYHDGQNGFVFGTNPAGIEYDGQVTNEGAGQFRSGSGGFNLNWNTSWSVQTTTTASGWSAEMRIPFRSLRYGSAPVQTWGINFQRNIRRKNEIAYWAPLPRQYNLYRLSQAGTLTGFAVPVQRNLKVTPYALMKSARGGGLGRDSNEEFGVDVKYSLTPSLTLDATINTDFAQVEADTFQVNLDRFSLFLPEQRPFFLENAGQFAVGDPREVELFFSRRIGIGDGGVPIPIDYGARLSGKVGGLTNVGFLHMRSDAVSGVAPQNDYTVARLNRELPNRSSIGGLIVNRKGDGSITGTGGADRNRTYAVDGRWGIGEGGMVTGFLASTDTPGRAGDDLAFQVDASYNSASWSNQLAYTRVQSNFNPEVGFLARNDYEKYEGRVFYRYRPDGLWGLHELRPHISYRSYWGGDGFHQTGFIHLDNHWEWKNGFEVHTGINLLHEGVVEPFEIVSGVTVDAGSYDDEEVQLVLQTNQGAALSFDVRARVGGLFGGDRVNLNPVVRYRIGETFTGELSWNHNQIDWGDGRDFRVGLGRLRMTYSFSPKMSLQALLQYNERSDLLSTNLRFAWLTSANNGLYVVLNEVDDRSFGGLGKPRREFIIKYSQIIDLL